MPAGSSISSGPEPSAILTGERFRLPVGTAEVAGVLHLPAARSPVPWVVACHGLGASKDSDKYLLLARELPAVGLALARFDFRGSGESGGPSGGATIASRIADLEAVLEHLRVHPRLDGLRLGLLGSSLGGFVALWVAARRAAAEGRARAFPVVTWNAPATLRDLAGAEGTEASGLGPALSAELREGRHVEVPPGARHVLVIQAAADAVVPPAHARILLERAAEPRELCLIPGADHRLSEPSHRLKAIEWSRRWLLRHLVAEPALNRRR